MSSTYRFHRETLPYRMDFQLAGTQCILSTNSFHALRRAERWRSAAPADPAKTFEMDLWIDPDSSAGSGSIGHFRGIRHLVFASLPPHGFLVYDFLRRRVHGVLSENSLGDAHFWDTLLLPISIGILGTTLGVAPVHAACLEGKSGGLLITGPSGAGKSTLTAALGERGFAIVSDDWTYLTRSAGGLLAHGLGAPLKLLPDSVRFFPRLLDHRPQRSMNGEIAYEVDPAAAFGFPARRSVLPRRLLFLERVAEPGIRFLRCDGPFALSYFENAAEKLPDELKFARDARSLLLHQLAALPAWKLRTGESPQRTAEEVEWHLEEAGDGAV